MAGRRHEDRRGGVTFPGQLDPCQMIHTPHPTIHPPGPAGFLHPPPAFPADFVGPLGTLRGLFKDACMAGGLLWARGAA